MNTIHAAPARTGRAGSSLRTAVNVFVAVLAALVATVALIIVLFAPSSGDAAPVQVSGHGAAQLAWDCPEGVDACVPFSRSPRPRASLA